ncbi:hypothetical protein BH10ACI4_BH10ACI4_05730 [soil metagenome]
MLRDEIFIRVFIRHQLTVILALSHMVSGQSIAQEPPTATLQIELVRDGGVQSVRPLFKVEMHNKTAQPLTLCLGMNVGGKNYAGEIKFSLADVSGKTLHLVKRDPVYIAGSLGPYTVTIPEGGTFELASIDLEDYWSYEPKIAALSLPERSYSLTAEYTGRDCNNDFIPLKAKPIPNQYTQRFWTGAVHSNVVAFMLNSPIGHADEH